jgi:hypothetical protein
MFPNRNDLARQYQEKMSALELKRVEVMRLSQDFESKMRGKEVSVIPKFKKEVIIFKMNIKIYFLRVLL